MEGDFQSIFVCKFDHGGLSSLRTEHTTLHVGSQTITITSALQDSVVFRKHHRMLRLIHQGAVPDEIVVELAGRNRYID